MHEFSDGFGERVVCIPKIQVLIELGKFGALIFLMTALPLAPSSPSVLPATSYPFAQNDSLSSLVRILVHAQISSSTPNGPSATPVSL
jgi:hypothetical protein